MSHVAYDQYRDSGSDWLGPIPATWSYAPVWAVASCNDEVLHESTAADEAILYVEISGVTAGQGITEATEYSFGAAPSRARRRVRDGDVLVSTVRTYLRAIAPVVSPPPNMIVSTGFAVLRPHGVAAKYLRYAVQAEYFISEVIARSVGVSYPAINASDLMRIRLPVPSPREQVAIAAFLDRETGKIDGLVEEQRRLIALLKEKRQAIISHAVSKGLDPNAKKKASGDEWLGDVPEHWEVRSIGSLSSVVRGASPRPAGDARYFGGSDVPWVTVAEITGSPDAELYQTENFLTSEGANQSRRFKAGTLIYSNSGATLGVPKILMIEACANDGVVGIEQLPPTVNQRFLYHFLGSITSAIRNKVKQGAGQPNLNTSIVRAIQLALPPLSEQGTIVAHVEATERRYRGLEAEATKAQVLLLERRAALISAAVTGEIDVQQPTNDREDAA